MTESTAALAGAADAAHETCTDPEWLREQAARHAAAAFIARSQADEHYRRADELEHLAALAEKADAADDALTALLQRTGSLEDAEAAAVTALREAEDHARVTRGRVTKARNAGARADASGGLEASEDAAAKTAKAERNLAAAEKALADRQQELQAAEKALSDHNREVAGATARAREATAAVMSPGHAPRKHGSLVPIGSLDDMTVDQKRTLALAMGMASRASGSAPAGPAPAHLIDTPNANGWRQVRGYDGQVVMIPPARPAGLR
jgi:chromosome segregation ATPase